MKPFSTLHYSRREAARIAAVSGLILPGLLRAGDSGSPLKLTAPLPRQVIQRTGFEPALAHDHAPGGPLLGQASLTIAGHWAGTSPARLKARAVLQEGCTGKAVDWTDLGEIAPMVGFSKSLTLPAGGWYRLETQALGSDGKVLAQASVEAVGCGEVFLISGQSYAAGANDEHLKVDDPLGRSVKYDWVEKRWTKADDPFPHVDTGGTIWPAFANMLQPLVRVPVGLTNVAVGGTASRQWLPGEALYDRFLQGGLAMGRFRAVLWQQGESDVIENTPTQTYVDRLKLIRSSLCDRWGFEPPWLLAKSTIHPTVYDRPEAENRIREAIGKLWQEPGFAPGPDTDILTGENRGGPTSRRHFSPTGQRRAGAMWFASVWGIVN
ncbi:hypothetical protein GC170_09305 [bacterium]|nr:hypothetical protein [bacterium]